MTKSTTVKSTQDIDLDHMRNKQGDADLVVKNRKPWFPAPWTLLIAVIATCFVLLTIDAGGGGSSAFLDAPGITLDESFNTQQGYFLCGAIKVYGSSFFNPFNQIEIFADKSYLEDHPPFGRWWIGLTHEMMQMMFGETGTKEKIINESFARVGSATAYGLLLYLSGYFATRWWGSLAGIFSTICIATMPRLFGHAHFASLESCLNLTYCLTVFYLVDRWANFSILNPQAQISNSELQPQNDKSYSGWMIPGLSMRTIIISGVLLGFTLLTKIQGVFLPVPLAVYALIIWRKQAIVPLILFGLIGVSFFFICWPYLWIDPVDHVMKYLGRTTDRITIHNYYMGQVYADKNTPWHYPWITFFSVIPLGFIIAATVCVWMKIRTEKRVLLLLMNVFFPLIVFTLPVAKYDGDRLFLMSFPLYGMLAGYGLKMIFTGRNRFSRILIVFQSVMSLCLPVISIVWIHPHQINYWNTAAPYLAQTDDMESNYWADGLSAKFIQKVSTHINPGETLYVSPVLHQFQIKDLMNQHSFIKRNKIELLPFEPEKIDHKMRGTTSQYLLCFNRKADIQSEVLKQLESSGKITILEQSISAGVLRAVLYKINLSSNE